MRINTLALRDFKRFDHCELALNGKSTVLFGKNGAGKSSALAAINYLCWNWIYRLNQAQGNAFKSLSASLVRAGSSKLEIAAEFELDEDIFLLKKEYSKARPGKGTAVDIQCFLWIGPTYLIGRSKER